MIINPNMCVGCGRCVEECPMKSITINDGIAQLVGPCINCSHCYSVCPKKAIEMEFSQVPTSGLSAYLYARKSVRNFKDATIPKEDLETILSRSSAYPSATNQKCAQVTIVTNPDILQEIKSDVITTLKSKFRLFEIPVIKDIVKLFLGDKYEQIYSYRKMVEKLSLDNDMITYNAPCLVFVHGDKNKPCMDEDAHYLTYNLILTSMEMGYGTCFMGFVRGQLSPLMKEAIDIPKNHKVYSVFCMGYPDVKYERSAPQPLVHYKVIE